MGYYAPREGAIARPRTAGKSSAHNNNRDGASNADNRNGRLDLDGLDCVR